MKWFSHLLRRFLTRPGNPVQRGELLGMYITEANRGNRNRWNRVFYKNRERV